LKTSIFVLALALSSGLLTAAAQQFTFALPEFEGRISLGIYDGTGKLVRPLFVNAEEEDFQKGLNGLIANWDGRDAAGQPVGSGTYSVRGFLVGDAVETEGVAFHFNDWVEDDASPRVVDVEAVVPTEADSFLLCGQGPAGPDGQPGLHAIWRFEESTGLKLVLSLPELWLSRGAGSAKAPVEELLGNFSLSAGTGETLWVAGRTTDKILVRQYAFDGELLREMQLDRDEAATVQLFADQSDRSFFLLLHGPAGRSQSLRGYRSLAAGPPPAPGEDPVSVDWEMFLDKSITPCGRFGWVDGQLLADAGTTPPVDRIRITLPPDTLNAKTSELELTVVSDPSGLWLQSGDGLNLLRLAEQPGRERVVLVRDGEDLRIFAGDGAVVAEYRVTGWNQIAPIDAGKIEIP